MDLTIPCPKRVGGFSESAVPLYSIDSDTRWVDISPLWGVLPDWRSPSKQPPGPPHGHLSDSRHLYASGSAAFSSGVGAETEHLCGYFASSRSPQEDTAARHPRKYRHARYVDIYICLMNSCPVPPTSLFPRESHPLMLCSFTPAEARIAIVGPYDRPYFSELKNLPPEAKVCMCMLS